MGTRVVTIHDLKPNQVFIKNDDYEKDIAKLKDTAVKIKNELTRTKKARVQDNILIEKLKTRLVETHKMLEDLQKKHDTTINIRGGADSSNVFNEVNKLLVEELNIPDSELKQMENDADNIINNLLRHG